MKERTLDHPEWWSPLWIPRHPAIPNYSGDLCWNNMTIRGLHDILEMAGNIAATNIIQFKPFFLKYHYDSLASWDTLR